MACAWACVQAHLIAADWDLYVALDEALDEGHGAGACAVVSGAGLQDCAKSSNLLARTATATPPGSSTPAAPCTAPPALAAAKPRSRGHAQVTAASGAQAKVAAFAQPALPMTRGKREQAAQAERMKLLEEEGNQLVSMHQLGILLAAVQEHRAQCGQLAQMHIVPNTGESWGIGRAYLVKCSVCTHTFKWMTQTGKIGSRHAANVRGVLAAKSVGLGWSRMRRVLATLNAPFMKEDTFSAIAGSAPPRTCTHTHTHAHMHARIRACAHARTLARSHAHSLARSLSHTHARLHAHLHMHRQIGPEHREARQAEHEGGSGGGNSTSKSGRTAP